MPFEYRPFPYAPPPGLTAKEPPHKVIIVGAGPTGLALAIGLAEQGVPCVVLDNNNVAAVGSRAISWSKRSLEVFDRLCIGDTVVDKGVAWKIARTYHHDAEVFSTDLLPEAGHKRPAFVNLQQYYIEQYLAQRALESELIDLRFLNTVTALEQSAEAGFVTVETPDGEYGLSADYIIACDGAKSPVRAMMRLDFEGELFEENFLIADIEMEADLPAERRFWFEPPFHPGQSALLHKQPDNMYRIDLQLGWDADPVEEKKPENVIPRIEAMLGHSDFRLEWVSIYSFQCRRLRSFVHGRVIFAGDSAHVFSPFGALGGNSGVQDADNLAWKLAGVLNRHAPVSLLDSYNRERIFAADANILDSTRTTRFMTPADGAERLFRDQVLALAHKTDFAHSWVNSGRIAGAGAYPSTAPDDPTLPAATRPGAVAQDAPQGDDWLLDTLGGAAKLLAINCAAPDLGLPVITGEANPILSARYLGDAAQALYLIRPDQVIAARWVKPDGVAVKTALDALWEGQE
ncbi:FAD-dependent monooxygenase [Actibacterium sp. D379-3]